MSKAIADYYATKRKIERLRKLSSVNAEPEKFTLVLKFVLQNLQLKAFTLENEYLYRSRWNEDGKLYLHVDELKYPKGDCVKEKGRLNDVGESVCYAALCELGTIIEVRPVIDRLFTISKIKRKRGAKPLFFPLGVLDRTFSAAPKNKTEQIIVEYLYSEITKRVTSTSEYNSTIALANIFLKSKCRGNGKFQYAGLTYPSVYGQTISSATTYNIAITPEMYEENYCIKETAVYCLTYEETHYQLNEINNGAIRADGKVDWKYGYEEMRERIRRGLLVDGTISNDIAKIDASLR